MSSPDPEAGERPPTILIDGPSGAGKSTLADGVIADWPQTGPSPQLVRLDDIYPGWGGLDAASEHIVTEILEPRARGAAGRWQRWDWVRDEPAEWHDLDAARPLVIEGCGALSRAAAVHSGIRLWITADDEVRKRRALARDAGAFDAHWDQWQAEWEAFVARERPETLATRRLDATTVFPHPTRLES